MSGEAKVPAARACPICGKPAQDRFKPFCSKRCADVDLQRWFTGRYAIPAAADDREPDDDGEERS